MDYARTGRILKSENVAYWKGKICHQCKMTDHGPHVCPTILCKFCGLNGLHKSQMACEAARGAKALQILALLYPPSSAETMDINVAGLNEFRETHKTLLSKMDEVLKSGLTAGDEPQQE